MTANTTSKNRSSRLTLLDSVKILIAFGLIIYVFTRFRISELISFGRIISWQWFFGAAVTYFLILFLTGYRYWLIIGRKAPYTEVLSASIIQTVIGNYIATSAGAVSFVSMLRLKNQISIGRGIGSLIVYRLTDLLFLYIFLGVSSIGVWESVTTIHWAVSLILLGLSIGFILLLLNIFFRGFIMQLLLKIQLRLNLDRYQLWKKFIKMLNDLEAQVRTYRLTYLIWYLVLSLFYFLIWFVNVYCNIKIFSIALNGWEVLFILSLSQILFIIPIQVLGGLGINEITFIYLYSLFGIDTKIAALSIISLRVIYYIFTLPALLYILSEILVRRRKNKFE